jgi:glyoxylase-like metal-dependent hydrolase (beta-lactamase superfamily II)
VPVTPLQQNCSLIWDTNTKHAAFVDPGVDIDTLIGALDHFGLTLKHIWLTHGHRDHAGAAYELRDRTGVPVSGRIRTMVLARPDQTPRWYGSPASRRDT